MPNNQQQMHLNLLQKEQFKKTAEATGDMISGKIANNINKASIQSPQNTSETVKRETEIPRERYVSPEERQQIIDELRLI